MYPRIPDEAFSATAGRQDELMAVTMGTATSAEEAGEAGHTYARSLGLDGENDQRAYLLAKLTLEYPSRETEHTVTATEVHAAVAGIHLGLELARQTGWEPPLAES
jgi:Flp pilus assembly protein TadD